MRQCHEVFQSQTGSKKNYSKETTTLENLVEDTQGEKSCSLAIATIDVLVGKIQTSSFPHYISSKSLGMIPFSFSTDSSKCAWVRSTVARSLLMLKLWS